jgi:hypothetical protein
MGALKKFKFEDMLDMKAERFIWFHPAAGFLLIFVGIPLFILACVCICAFIITFPIACCLSWL